ncbi:Hismacro and sec14 domain-containing protein, partial [Globisporangium splendens]
MATTRARTAENESNAGAAATKRQCSEEAAPASKESAAATAEDDHRAAVQLFAVELLTQKIVKFLDARSVVCFVAFLRSRDAWRSILSDEKLWDELLQTHFGGLVPVPAPLQHEQQHQDDASDDEDVSDEEEEDEDDEEEDEDGNQSARAAQNGSATAAPAGEQASDSTDAADAKAPAILTLETPSFACGNFMHFVRSCRERRHFGEAVSIIQGDIGTISSIHGRSIDAIAFATGGSLHNPYVGAAEVVFRRAGPELDRHISERCPVYINAGYVHVTPGFGAGVAKLIHCCGPVYRGHRCFSLLARTYESVMLAAEREKLHCIAMTSISTGNMGFPAQEAAKTGLRALQNFIRARSWDGTLAIVCFDTSVYNAFAGQKQRILDAFNAVES